jgi:hypothetical protein
LGTRIYHQPRVAWDFAQTVVAVTVADDDTYDWFSSRVGDLMGASYAGLLLETRTRLAQPGRDDARQVEAGLWRVRLEDLLRTRNELTEDLYILTRATDFRMAGAPRP